MLSFITGALGFLGRLPGGALNLIDRRRQWATADRVEIDGSFTAEIASLKEELAEAEGDDERLSLKEAIKRARQEQRSFHRARRELLLSKSLVKRMTPTGAITAGEPALPQADREALEAATSVVARLEPPKTFNDYFSRGNAFNAAGQFDKALEQYDRALKLRPDDPIVLNNLGVTLDELERYDEALADYNRALELSPDHPEILSNRGVTLRKLERYDDALADFSRSLELRPDDPGTLNNRGVTLGYLQRYDEALADFNRSLELRPNDPSTLHNRGMTLGNLQRYDEALADFNRSLELRPDHPDSFDDRGVTLIHLQRYEEALADFNRSLELRPADPNTVYNRACVYSHLHRASESLKDLKEAISRDDKFRKMARDDEDFGNLRSDPTLGPEFERLVAEPD